MTDIPNLFLYQQALGPFDKALPVNPVLPCVSAQRLMGCPGGNVTPQQNMFLTFAGSFENNNKTEKGVIPDDPTSE